MEAGPTDRTPTSAKNVNVPGTLRVARFVYHEDTPETLRPTARRHNTVLTEHEVYTPTRPRCPVVTRRAGVRRGLDANVLKYRREYRASGSLQVVSSTVMSTTTLRLAVCLFPDLTPLDFLGPVQVLGLLEPKNIQAHRGLYPTLPSVQIEATYFSHNREPVVGDVGPGLIPQRTYGEVLENFEQYDLVLVPGGAS